MIIPAIVRREIVDEGKARGFPDAEVVERDIEAGRLTTVNIESNPGTGDDALLEAFHRGSHDIVASDDVRLLRRLRALRVPCVVPALLVYRLFSLGVLDRGEAQASLRALAPFISEDQFGTVRLLLEVPR